MIPERLPPCDTAAEAGILGCILLKQDCIADCIAARMHDGWCYDVRHQMVYNAMLYLYDQHKAIDLVNLSGVLKGQPPMAFVQMLPDQCGSPAALPDYLEAVRNKYTLRRVLQACSQISSRTYEVNGDFKQFSDTAQRQFDEALAETTQITKTPSVKELVREAIDRMEWRHQNQGKICGLTTGFPDLDKLTDGMHDGEMIVLAARPSVGKSSLMMNIAEHVTLSLGLGVAVFSLEMRAPSLIDRTLSSMARVNLRGGAYTERDIQKLTTASIKLGKAPLFIDDTPGMSIMQIRAKAQRLVQMHNIKMVGIDYLQLATGERKDSREQEVTSISHGIKNLASELNIPVLALSQLNRLLDRDKARRPKLSDLRESGSLEQDADSVWFLYNKGDEDSDRVHTREVNLLVGKNRNGPSGEDVPLVFLKTYTRFESASRIATDDQYGLPYKD